jgi:hypothetical protein
VLAMRRSRRRSSWFRSHMAPSSTPFHAASAGPKETLRRPLRRRRPRDHPAHHPRRFQGRARRHGDRRVVDFGADWWGTHEERSSSTARSSSSSASMSPTPASRSHKSNGTRSSGTRRPRRRLPGRPEPEGRHRDHHVARRPGLTNYVWYIAPDMRRAWVAGRLPTGGIASSVASGGASDGPGGKGPWCSSPVAPATWHTRTHVARGERGPYRGRKALDSHRLV